MESVDLSASPKTECFLQSPALFGTSPNLRSMFVPQSAVEANAAALASVVAVVRITAFHYDKNSSCKPNPLRYSDHMKKQFDTFGKTQSEIKQHLKRTRKTRVRELCAKYNTTSYSEASYLDTLDLCARINAHLASLKK